MIKILKAQINRKTQKSYKQTNKKAQINKNKLKKMSIKI